MPKFSKPEQSTSETGVKNPFGPEQGSVTPKPFANALILTGPTGSGKSALALQIAETLNAEIISADSMTLYRGMDIGTAKPTLEDRRRIRHHLIDVLDPWDSANVAWWLERARLAVEDVERRGRLALIVGGTPFYLKALLCGLFESAPADEEYRRSLEEVARTQGSQQLHVRLREIDPESANRLHVNDVRRIVRALEVWHLTKKPISDWQRQGWWNGEPPRFEPGKCLAIETPRQELYARIDERVEQMFAAGWVEEVRRLSEQRHPLSREAGQAIGYREIIRHLAGEQTFTHTIAEVQLRTRQFAKRQLTWFRGLAGCVFCDRELILEQWAINRPVVS